MHPEFGGDCSIDEIDARRKLVQDNNWTIGQQWYEAEQILENTEIFQFFRNALAEFVPTLYPELNKDNIMYYDNFTLYENGDFIENHNDGGYDSNRGRLCVILIYLSDEKDHKDGGGEFILRDDKLHEEILPFKGNFVILDFTKHNLFHEVKKVKNNFQRFCYISFVSNKEKKNE
jgi:Rps23 Pro-64 3,4-dihydroxylase Tpa1-like proline 4-hydroxylase